MINLHSYELDKDFNGYLSAFFYSNGTTKSTFYKGVVEKTVYDHLLIAENFKYSFSKKNYAKILHILYKNHMTEDEIDNWIDWSWNMLNKSYDLGFERGQYKERALRNGNLLR